MVLRKLEDKIRHITFVVYVPRTKGTRAGRNKNMVQFHSFTSDFLRNTEPIVIFYVACTGDKRN